MLPTEEKLTLQLSLCSALLSQALAAEFRILQDSGFSRIHQNSPELRILPLCSQHCCCGVTPKVTSGKVELARGHLSTTLCTNGK